VPARIIDNMMNWQHKCGKCMKIISFIEDDDTIMKILKHLNLWMPQNHDPPQDEITHFSINVQLHRGFEWWEALHNFKLKKFRYCQR
jgi:hypothetical protein